MNIFRKLQTLITEKILFDLSEINGEQNNKNILIKGVTMKEYFKQISNKTKSIYCVWCLLQLILLFVFSNGLFMPYSEGLTLISDDHFFPFSRRGFEVYDYTEFIIYTISPILIGYSIYLWRHKRIDRYMEP
jgi:hypothetical protein